MKKISRVFIGTILLTGSVFALTLPFSYKPASGETRKEDLGYIKFHGIKENQIFDKEGVYVNSDYNEIATSGWEVTSKYYNGGECHYNGYDQNKKTLTTVKLAESYYYFANYNNDKLVNLNIGDTATLYFKDYVSNSNGYGKFYILPIRFKVTKQATNTYLYEDTSIDISLKSNSGDIVVDNDNKTIYVSPYSNKNNIEVVTSGTNGGIDFKDSIDANGNFIKNKYELNTTYKVLAQAKDNGYYFQEAYNLVVGYHDFNMLAGASVYNTVHTATISTSVSISNSLINNYPNAKFGMLYVKKSDLKGEEFTANNVFNSSKFTFNTKNKSKIYVHKDTDLVKTTDGDNTILTGKLIGIVPNNYNEEYISVAYMENNGDYVFSNYANNEQKYNTTSVSYIAQKMSEKGSSNYSHFLTNSSNDVICTVNCYDSDLEHTLLDSYTIKATRGESLTVTAKDIPYYDVKGESSISKMIYGSNNIFNFTYEKNFSQYGAAIYAWDLPTLDPYNNYINDYNEKVTSELKNAGINTALVYGTNFATEIYNQTTVDALKHLINGYYHYDMRTIIGGNSSFKYNRRHFASNVSPDWSDCAGFYGFLEWDEPQKVDLAKIGEYAASFSAVHGDTNAKYITNLHPSYSGMADIYGDSSYTGNKEADYTAYCQAVIANITSKAAANNRYFSIDCYPIDNKNGKLSLREDFPFDTVLASLYATDQQGTSMMCLQGSAYQEGSDTSKTRVPNQLELNIQTSVAIACGIKDISWFTYGASASARGQTADNKWTVADNQGNIINQDLYNALGNTNKLFNTQRKLLQDYTWFGTASKNVSDPLDNVDGWFNDGNNKRYINSDITKMSSVITKVDDPKLLNTADYIMSVFKNGSEEAFTLCNYNASGNKSTLKLTFNKNMTIYRNGVLDGTISANTATSISVASGECLIIK